jgi:hypothetical protein
VIHLLADFVNPLTVPFKYWAPGIGAALVGIGCGVVSNIRHQGEPVNTQAPRVVIRVEQWAKTRLGKSPSKEQINADGS